MQMGGSACSRTVAIASSSALGVDWCSPLSGPQNAWRISTGLSVYGCLGVLALHPPVQPYLSAQYLTHLCHTFSRFGHVQLRRCAISSRALDGGISTVVTAWLVCCLEIAVCLHISRHGLSKQSLSLVRKGSTSSIDQLID